MNPLDLLWPAPRRVEPAPGSFVPDRAPPKVRFSPDAALRAGGYRLRAGPQGAEIDAADAEGARYAAATLAQAVRLHERGPSIPAFAIEDAPDFPRRGVLLDVSRSRVPTLETLRSLVDWLASLKINELQLYTEHAFAYAGHEDVWRGSSAYTAEEIRSLDAHCRARGIDLVPNQQSLGHMHRWLALDGYRHLAEVPEGVDHAFGLRREPFSLCPTDPAVLAFLAGLYDQLLPCFSSALLDVGLDEAFDVGAGRSRAACEARGKGRVYAEFLGDVHRLAAERGKRIQCWADGMLQHRELLAGIPRDVTLLLWGYEAGHPFQEEARALAESGLPFYVCPGTSSWQSVAGRISNARANLASAALHGREARAGGYLVTDWGDRGHLQPLFASLPGFLLGAGFGWNASAAERGGLDLRPLLDAHAFQGTPGAGRAALDLGDVHLETGCASTNGSALFFLLAFAAEPLPHARLPGLSSEGLRKARAFLQERTFPLAEMRWAADLLLFACDLGIARLATPAGAPVGAIPGRERRQLAGRLRPLAAEHRRLWLERNRPGGLDESAGWLERPLALLEA